MSDYIARRPQIRPDPANQLVGLRIPLRRGQPLLVGPGAALPMTTFPVVPGYVRFTTREGGLRSLDVMTAGEARMLPEGYAAGWEVIARPGRVSRLKWTGGGGLRQAIPLTMDVLHYRGIDIEEEWQALRQLARPPRGERPPALRIAGPVDHKDLDWVIVALEPLDDTRRRGHKMVRQSFLVTLGQWEEDKVRKSLRRSKPAKDKPRQVQVTYERRTLKAIAKYYLNDASRWKEIARLNKGLNDPARRLAVGTKIQIPAI